MLVFSIENQIQFHYHPEWLAVRAEWLWYGPSGLQRLAMMRGAAFCADHAEVTAWIIDLRQTRGAMVQHDPDWLARVFQPALARTSVRRFINILPPALVDPNTAARWERAGPGYEMADAGSLAEAGRLLTGALV